MNTRYGRRTQCARSPVSCGHLRSENYARVVRLKDIRYDHEQDLERFFILVRRPVVVCLRTKYTIESDEYEPR